MFTGLVSSSTISSISQFKQFEPVLPYFYLCRQLRTAEEKCECFNSLLELYIGCLRVYPHYSKYFLYVTYFCISDNYECLDNRSLGLLLEIAELAGEVGKDCLSHFSIEHLFTKKLELPEKLKTICKIPSKSFYQVVEADWKEMWSGLQSFSRFWAHPGFNFQRNRPFDAREYVYNPTFKTFYQWSISNFITKEWARPLI